MADDLAAELDGAPVGQGHRLDAAAHARAGLEHEHVGTAARQVTRRRQSREAGSQHNDIGHARTPLTQSTRLAA